MCVCVVCVCVCVCVWGVCVCCVCVCVCVCACVCGGCVCVVCVCVCVCVCMCVYVCVCVYVTGMKERLIAKLNTSIQQHATVTHPHYTSHSKRSKTCLLKPHEAKGSSPHRDRLNFIIDCTLEMVDKS